MAAIDHLCVNTALCESVSGIASMAYVLSKRPLLYDFGLYDFVYWWVPRFNVKCLIVVKYVFQGKRYDTFRFL